MKGTYVDHVVHGTVLGNGDEGRLVVRGGVDRGETVGTSRKTSGDISSEDVIHSLAVETLEEGEAGRVCRGRLLKRVDRLDDDVRVALDLALCVDLLGRGEVVLIRVHEVAGLKVVDCHLDRELGVRLDRLEVHRELELARWHVRRGRDDTHGRGVARTRLDLLAVCDRQVGHRQAEVDEVVRRRERCDLTGLRLVLAVVLETRGDDTRVKGERGLRVVTGTVAAATAGGSGAGAGAGRSSSSRCGGRRALAVVTWNRL